MDNYIILCYSLADLEDLYADLETPGGTLYIPNRSVECVLRRPGSRNTVYSLTAEEVELLKNDPRIKSIALEAEVYSIEDKIRGWTEINGNFDKSTTTNGNELNWALLRCLEGITSSDNSWGTNVGATAARTVTITSTTSGKHVDVFICDGHINPTHPEFLDDNGRSRVKQVNWDIFSVLQAGSGSYPTSRGAYIYGDGIGSDFTEYGSDHGMHVAGTTAGKTQGWAKDATIYNLSPYGNGGDVANTNNPNDIGYRNNKWDYIRLFHVNKPVNPYTGRKNPTIVTASFGSGYTLTRTNTSITFRGTQVTTDASVANGVSSADLFSWGWGDTDATNLYPTYREGVSEFLVAEIEDMIDAGVILISAAGNYLECLSLEGEVDWDNICTSSGGTVFQYCRGDYKMYNGVLGIAVGNIDTEDDDAKYFGSARGPGIDVWAPGTNIMSALHAIGDDNTTTKVNVNSWYYGKYTGTSMACPQVAGIIACLAEATPNLSNDEARKYIQTFSKKDQITNYGSDFTNSYWLADTNNESNRYLFHQQLRQTTGCNIRVAQGVREQIGFVFPRTAKQIRTKITNETGRWFIGYRVGIGVKFTNDPGLMGWQEDATGTFETLNASDIRCSVGDVVTICNYAGNGVYGSGNIIFVPDDFDVEVTTLLPNLDIVINEDQGSFTFKPETTGNFNAYVTIPGDIPAPIFTIRVS